MNLFLTGIGLLIVVTGAPCCFSAEPPVPRFIESAPAANTNGIGPRIQFASTVYEFGKALVGEQIRHDFIFTNTGDDVLRISGVYPSCGCTTAGTWSREIPPGGSGIIPLQFNSGHFGGQTVTKTATVVCNDKEQGSIVLQIKGTIWKPIEINPQPAILSLVTDSPSNATAVVSIVSSLDEAITLSEPTSSNPVFAATLKTIKPGKEFQLQVTTQQALQPGNVQGTINIKTSSTNVPAIDVPVLAIIQPAIAILPAQIVLPPGPLNSAFSFPVIIRNNAATPLILSEPGANVAGVQVQMNESRPGHQFMLTTTFPAGFQIQPDTEIVVSVKTSSPQMPIIRLPVRQNLRAMPSASFSPVHNRGPAPPAPASPARP